jgi:hypothetical protein
MSVLCFCPLFSGMMYEVVVIGECTYDVLSQPFSVNAIFLILVLTLSYTPRVCKGLDHFEAFYLPCARSKNRRFFVQLFIFILLVCKKI